MCLALILLNLKHICSLLILNMMIVCICHLLSVIECLLLAVCSFHIIMKYCIIILVSIDSKMGECSCGNMVIIGIAFYLILHHLTIIIINCCSGYLFSLMEHCLKLRHFRHLGQFIIQLATTVLGFSHIFSFYSVITLKSWLFLADSLIWFSFCRTNSNKNQIKALFQT